MQFSFRARALVLTVAAGSMLAVPYATSADAAPVKQPVTCKGLTVKTVGTKSTVVVSKCTPLAATGGGGTSKTTAGQGVLTGKTVSTTTWNTKHGTTKATVNFKPNPKGKGKCTAGGTRLSITGKVVSSTGLAAKVIKANQPVTASVCNYASGPNKGKTLLEPGTVFKL